MSRNSSFMVSTVDNHESIKSPGGELTKSNKILGLGAESFDVPLFSKEEPAPFS